MSQFEPIIKLNAVHKHYQKGDMAIPVLRGIDLTIMRGEFVAIMGQSGSGKSTLMNLIGCLDTFNRGEYIFDGHDVSRMDSTALAKLRSLKIGFIFQSFNLIPQMTALRNVELPMIYSGKPREARHRLANAMLDMLGLEDRVDHLPAQLSGGQQQRVAIARALVNNPSLLVADEPTGSLDSHTGELIMQQLAKVHKTGTTVLLVTHEPHIAEYAERTVIISDGQIVKGGD